jgi:hypothetical protein
LLSVGEGAVILLGFLDIDGDALSPEDPSGTVPLDVAGMSLANGIFSVGSIVVVQSDYRDGRMFGALVGHPPATGITSFEQHFWKHPTDPFGWRLTRSATAALDNMLLGEHRDSLVVFMSDVWVDAPAVVDNFNHLLSQFDHAPECTRHCRTVHIAAVLVCTGSRVPPPVWAVLRGHQRI